MYRTTCIAITIMCPAATVAYPAAAMAVTYLANPGVYTNLAASSTFTGMPVDLVFDSTLTDWAIDGYRGNNPQGRDEGWVSATLDKSYLVSHLRFAPRKASGTINGIDDAYVWLSDAPFGVNVASAASTTAFLATAKGGAPDLTVGPFSTANL